MHVLCSGGTTPRGFRKPTVGTPALRAEWCLGEASDIAEAVLFLDSDGAKYISGHELVVDGGVSTSVMAHLPRE